METNIQIFENPKFGEVRVVGTSEEPLFCLLDICKAVGLTNPSSVKQRLDDEDVQLVDLHALNSAYGAIGNTTTNFITEAGLYDVLLQSSSLKVKPFRKWVTSEVLPAIRKTGGYMVARPDETSEELLSRALLVAHDALNRQKQRLQILEGEKELLETEVKQLAPKAEYTDRVLQSITTYTMTQVAKEIGMSAVALEKELHGKGVIFKQSGQWILYARYQDKGYTRPRTHYYSRSDGTTGTNTITVWTEKGREFIHSLFKKVLTA
jgi:prophage antirepressor-like protein